MVTSTYIVGLNDSFLLLRISSWFRDRRLEHQDHADCPVSPGWPTSAHCRDPVELCCFRHESAPNHSTWWFRSNRSVVLCLRIPSTLAGLLWAWWLHKTCKRRRCNCGPARQWDKLAERATGHLVIYHFCWWLFPSCSMCYCEFTNMTITADCQLCVINSTYPRELNTLHVYSQSYEIVSINCFNIQDLTSYRWPKNKIWNINVVELKMFSCVS